MKLHSGNTHRATKFPNLVSTKPPERYCLDNIQSELYTLKIALSY